MRRWLGLASLVAFAACCAAGIVVLLLPYDHTTNVPGFVADVDVRCQAPLVDAVSTADASDGWFVMDRTDTGVTFSDGIDDRGDGSTTTTGGSLCYPDSVQRAALGVGLVTLGGTGLLGWQLLRIRRRNRGDDLDESDDLDEPDEPEEPDGDLSPAPG